METLRNVQRGLIRDGSGVGITSQLSLLPEHNLNYFYLQKTSKETSQVKLSFLLSGMTFIPDGTAFRQG
jgi:hypothetical protein